MSFQLNARQRAWLFLSSVPYLGPATLKRLYQQLGSASAIVATPVAMLARYGLKRPSLDYLSQWQSNQSRSPADEQIIAITAWLDTPGAALLTPECPDYPELLKELHDPPAVLYVLGDAALLSLPQIAIVGSRNATVYGREAAYQFAKQLSINGWVPTSGLARGVDAQAHLGALDGIGLTVAVMGTGIDSIYPKGHQALAQRIVDAGGAIISEYPLHTPPRAQNFPRRNRIISGLSMATLVVEASPNSGSLITARQALDQGREVFAIPGSIHNPLSKGCHELIRSGAKLVEQVNHMFEELAPQLSLLSSDDSWPVKESSDPVVLNSSERKLLDLIGYDLTSIDSLIDRSGFSAENAMSVLMELELKGLALSVAGGYLKA
ncbi:MAG: DNA-processing protein DprA [Motiliproteus sp.]